MFQLIASICHFLSIIVYCQILRAISNKFIKSSILRLSVEEFICTLQLCASNFELGVVTEVYGFSGYALGLFFTSLAYSLTFQDGTADPSECLDKMCKQQITIPEFLSRSFSSLLGAAVSYKAARLFWALKFIPEHAVAFDGLQTCTASLQVPVLLGVLFEGGETLVNRLIQNSHGFSMLSGALSDVAITFFGLFVTGGYFNPSLAFAMEFGCAGITWESFFLIYFGAPAIATLISLVIAPRILQFVQAGDSAVLETTKEHIQ